MNLLGLHRAGIATILNRLSGRKRAYLCAKRPQKTSTVATAGSEPMRLETAEEAPFTRSRRLVSRDLTALSSRVSISALIADRSKAGEIGQRPLPPTCPMENEHNEPNDLGERPAGDGDDHQPTQYSQRMQKLAIIFPSDHARMDRFFIHSQFESS